MNTRLVLVGLSLVCASLVAAPVAAQVYTGRIDVTIKDSTGAVLPGVTVEAVGTQTDVAVTDAKGEAHFVNLAPGRYTVTAKLAGLYRLPERERAGQRRLHRAARGDDERRRPVRESRRHHGDTGHRDQEADRLDQRQPRRAAEHSERARSVGGAPDRSRHHRRSRQRRRRRIGAAVQLPGQGCEHQTEHLEHGRDRDHRHGLARLVSDLLRLRHVPGDAGHDRRRRSGERHAGRAAQLRVAERHQQVARHAPATTSRTTACSPTTCRRISSARSPATTGLASTRTGASRAAGRSCRARSSRGARMARRSPR